MDIHLCTSTPSKHLLTFLKLHETSFGALWPILVPYLNIGTRTGKTGHTHTILNILSNAIVTFHKIAYFSHSAQPPPPPPKRV